MSSEGFVQILSHISCMNFSLYCQLHTLVHFWTRFLLWNSSAGKHLLRSLSRIVVRLVDFLLARCTNVSVRSCYACFEWMHPWLNSLSVAQSHFEPLILLVHSKIAVVFHYFDVICRKMCIALTCDFAVFRMSDRNCLSYRPTTLLRDPCMEVDPSSFSCRPQW